MIEFQPPMTKPLDITTAHVFGIVDQLELPLPIADLDHIAEAVRRMDLSIIATSEDVKVLLAFRDVIKAGRDTLEDLRMDQLGDLKKQTSAIDAYFRRYRRPLDQALERATDKENGFRREQRRVAEEEAARQRKVEEDRVMAEAIQREEEAAQARVKAFRLASEGKTEQAAQVAREAEEKLYQADHMVAEAVEMPLPPVLVGPTKHTSVFGGKSFEKRFWTYEITDFEAIPREWLIIDHYNVNDAIQRKDNPVRNIAGLRIFEDIKSRHG